MLLYREALYTLRIFVSFGTCFAIAGNSQILSSVKRTAHKTDFLFQILNLDNVFSNVFCKASSYIISWILDNTSKKIIDVADFITRGLKSTDEEVLSVNGEFYPNQAEKLRIIWSHMDSLELRKLNVESLILTVAKKYITQIDLVSTVLGIRTFATIGINSDNGVDMSVLPTSNHLFS